MKFLPLVWAGMWRRRGRAILTLLSIVNAFLLFGLLQGFVAGLGRGDNAGRAQQLVTVSRVNGLVEPLLIAQLEPLRSAPGVRAAMPVLMFPGTYRKPTEAVQAFAVDPLQFRATDPVLAVTPAQMEALQRTRTGVLVPSQTAKTFGIKVGDRISVHSTLWSNRDGSPNWPLDVVGVFPTNKDDEVFGQSMLLNYAYVDESRSAFNGTASAFLVRVNDPAAAEQVGATVDSLFANSAHETKTVPVSDLQKEQIRKIGDIGFVIHAVVGAMFFALLFSIGAVILQGVRERSAELAVLKTLGFSDRAVLSVILAETTLLCFAGAGVGLALATSLFPAVAKLTGFAPLAGPTLIMGFVAAAALAIVAGMPPAWLGMRLRIVDALAGR